MACSVVSPAALAQDGATAFAGGGDRPGQEWTNAAGMIFCWCPPGSFTMGSPDGGDPLFKDAAPVAVTLSRGFWIGKTEVTVRDFQAVTRKEPKAMPLRDPKAPACGVGWSNATDFCKKLTEQARAAGGLPDGWGYALPTEAEWEYACRAGSSTRYSFGDDASTLQDHANFADRTLREDEPDTGRYALSERSDGAGNRPAPVGRYRPNPWGLHDMHGNVWEWCQDGYAERLAGGPDPLALPEKVEYRVMRGGGWTSLPAYCRSDLRHRLSSGENHPFVGFRVVLRKAAP